MPLHGHALLNYSRLPIHSRRSPNGLVSVVLFTSFSFPRMVYLFLFAFRPAKERCDQLWWNNEQCLNETPLTVLRVSVGCKCFTTSFAIFCQMCSRTILTSNTYFIFPFFVYIEFQRARKINIQEYIEKKSNDLSH